VELPQRAVLDRLPVVGPGIEGQYRLERVPTDDQGVDSCDELRVPVWLSAAGRQKVEFAGGASDEAVETRANKYGGSRCPVSCCGLTLATVQDATGRCRPQAVGRRGDRTIIRTRLPQIASAVASAKPGGFVEVTAGSLTAGRTTNRFSETSTTGHQSGATPHCVRHP
jgi:hypothetical protein